MDHDTPFEPLNDLEVRLLQAQDGTLTAAQFLDGLLTSTALNMFVVPALYLRFGSRGKPAASEVPTAHGA